jgi:hypothetical protein
LTSRRDGVAVGSCGAPRMSFFGFELWFCGCLVRSCVDLVLVGVPVGDRSVMNLVVGEVDCFWGVGFWPGLGELCQCLGGCAALMWCREIG